ncbi:hypothetical protein TrRE_jg11860 [Triparma retinervis]|uniref:Uncharacterized protein n=1 Tax=Triparma retinervis TaxID=2557542 RepID=A0A9W7KTR7_9STRA|nr:hypothetical protein TrRE_jg11860 [Triparma retinervis]
MDVGKGHRGGGINKVAVHPIFELAATAGEDGTVKLWDLESGDFAKTLKGHTAGVQCVVWSGAGDLLVSCGADLSVKVWDAGDGYACRRTMRGHGHNVCAAAFCRLEGVQDKGVATTGRDGTIRIWDLKTGFCVHTIRARAEPPVWLRDLKHSNWVRDLLVSTRSADYVLSVGDDRCMMVLDVKNRRCLREIKDAGGHFVQAVGMHEKLPVVVTAGVDNEVRIWKCE